MILSLTPNNVLQGAQCALSVTLLVTMPNSVGLRLREMQPVDQEEAVDETVYNINIFHISTASNKVDDFHYQGMCPAKL